MQVLLKLRFDVPVSVISLPEDSDLNSILLNSRGMVAGVYMVCVQTFETNRRLPLAPVLGHCHAIIENNQKSV